METRQPKKTIQNEDISPIVLTCISQFKGMEMPPGQRFTRRTVFDYELEFITNSNNGSMLIDDEEYPIGKGDVIFKRPGTVSQGILPYNCYLICFDMLGNTRKNPNSYNFLEEQKIQDDYSNPILDAIPTIIHTSSYEKYNFLFSSVFSEFVASSPNNQILLRSYVLQILYQLYTDSVNLKRENFFPSSAYYTRLKEVCDHIKQNLKARLDLKVLSEITGWSPFYFQRIFKQTMGVSPNVYILQLRLGMAKELLVKTNMPISEVALECGFQNIPYFSYVFKQHMKITPGEFRRRHQYI